MRTAKTFSRKLRQVQQGDDLMLSFFVDLRVMTGFKQESAERFLQYH